MFPKGHVLNAWCAEEFFITVKNTLEKNLKGGEIYLGS
jgi:hypothetical protein